MDIQGLLLAAAAGAAAGLVAVFIFDAVGRPSWRPKRKKRADSKQ